MNDSQDSLQDSITSEDESACEDLDGSDGEWVFIFKLCLDHYDYSHTIQHCKYA